MEPQVPGCIFRSHFPAEDGVSGELIIALEVETPTPKSRGPFVLCLTYSQSCTMDISLGLM